MITWYSHTTSKHKWKQWHWSVKKDNQQILNSIIYFLCNSCFTFEVNLKKILRFCILRVLGIWLVTFMLYKVGCFYTRVASFLRFLEAILVIMKIFANFYPDFINCFYSQPEATCMSFNLSISWWHFCFWNILIFWYLDYLISFFCQVFSYTTLEGFSFLLDLLRCFSDLSISIESILIVLDDVDLCWGWSCHSAHMWFRTQ